MRQQQFHKQTLFSFFAALLLAALGITASWADTSSTYARFNEAGELIRPAGYREWVFIGAHR